MLPISVCMIMKNEEKNIRRCLESLKKYDFELILVDTGSTDATVEIAAEYTDTIYQFAWMDDFSTARNYSLALASYDWVLVLDCDEFITRLDTDSLLEMSKEYPNGVGLLTRHNHYEMNGTDAVYTDLVERFFNRRKYHYEGRVHEQVVPFLDFINSNTLLESITIDLTVEHTGYSGSKEELEAKAMRDAALLLEILQSEPGNPYLYFQLGQSYNMIHDDEKAAYYYGLGLSYDVDPSLEYVQMMVIGYGYALLHLERFEEALQFQSIYDDFSSLADFLCLMGLIYLRAGKLLNAMAEFLKALSCPTAHVEGANSFIAYYNMGCINELLGEKESALTLYRKCGDFAPALERIHDLEH